MDLTKNIAVQLLGRLSLLFALSVAVIACSSEPAALSSAAQADIYAAVIRQIVTVDDTFGGTLQPPVVYVVTETDDTVGDPDLEALAPQTLSAELQNAISTRLADLPAEIKWTAEPDMLPQTENGRLADDGVIVRVGNIHAEADDSVLVSASIYVAQLAAGGRTYIVEEAEGNWTVTGDTGVIWIS